MKWSKYNYIYKSSIHGPLLFNKLSGAFFDLSDKEVYAEFIKIKENPNEFDYSKHDGLSDILLSSAVICHDDDNNKNLLIYSQLFNRFDPIHRNLTILPTMKCNLQCTYCFEGALDEHKKMSKSVIEKVKAYLKEVYSNRTEPLTVNWFGGEPLMAFDVMDELTNFIKTINTPFNSSITTNGVLLDRDKIIKLQEMHINTIQITIDGTKEIHDTKRIFKNGEGTYDIIMRNMKFLHNYVEKYKNIRVDIRVNIDKENRDLYHKIHVDLAKEFPIFAIYPGIIIQYDSCSNTIPCFTNKREEAEFYIEQYEKHQLLPQVFNISSKGMRNCMAEMPTTDVIGPEGEFYLCLKDVGDKSKSIGSLFEGKNNISLISAYCSGNLTFNSKECRDCDIVSFCGGGCVNHRYAMKIFNENHNECAAYKDKIIFEKYLDLHYEIKKRHNENY